MIPDGFWAGRALVLAGAAAWLAVCSPAGRGQMITGGPGDAVPEFHFRDPRLPLPDGTGLVRAIARAPGEGWWAAGRLPGSSAVGQPQALWRLDAAGRLSPSGREELMATSDIGMLAVMADGRLVLGGAIGLDPGRWRPRHRSVVRLLPDGRMDPTFSEADWLQPEGGPVRALAVLPDGGVLLGGDFSGFKLGGRESWPSPGLIRLRADGLPLFSWNSPLAPAVAGGGSRSQVNALAVRPDGAAWVGGDFETYNGRHRHLVRLTPAGAVDEAFDAGGVITAPVLALAAGGDGALWVATAGGLFRLRPDGRADPAFPERLPVNGSIHTLLPDGDGVWLAGRFSRVADQPRANLAWVDRRGNVATNTPPATLTAWADGPPAAILALALDRHGALLVGGEFRRINGVGRPGLARLEPGGEVDPNWLRQGLHPQTAPAALASDAGGGLWLSGFNLECHGWRRSGLLRLRPDGGVDRSFDSARSVQQGRGRGVAHFLAGPAGITLAGSLPNLPGATATLLRLRPDGSLDPEFGPDGLASSLPGTEADVWAMLPLKDGSLLVAGLLRGWGTGEAPGLHRLHPDGRLDPAFVAELPPVTEGISGFPVSALLLEADGRILVGGPGRLARLEPDGRLAADLTAAHPALRELLITRLFPGGDGTVLVETYRQGSGVWRTLKLEAGGRPASGFLAQDHRLFGVWPDGRLLLGSVAGIPPARLLRAFPNGRPDGSFSLAWTNATLRLATLLPDASVAAVLHAGTRLELLRLRGDAPALSRFRLEARGGVSLDVSGSPGAEMLLEVSADWRTWTEVARRRLPPAGHERWTVPPAAWRDGPAAFFRARPAGGGGP